MGTSRTVAIGLVAGSALGLAERSAHHVHALPVWTLAALGVPWLAVAFAVGALAVESHIAAVCGALALVAATATYYATMLFVEHRTTAAYALEVGAAWAVAAAASGAAFGAFGAIWRQRSDTPSIAAAAAVSGAFVGEALLLANLWEGGALRAAVACELALGVALPFMMARSKLTTALLLTVAAAAIAAGVEWQVRDVLRAAGWRGA